MLLRQLNVGQFSMAKRLLRKPKRGGVTFYDMEIVEFRIFTVVQVKSKSKSKM